MNDYMLEEMADAIANVGGAIVASAGTVICGIGTLAVARFGKVHQAGVTIPIALFIVLSPLLGFVLGYLMMSLLNRLHSSSIPAVVDRRFRRLQLVSAAFYSLGHGTNDAQKTMGIITVLLYSQGYLSGEFHVPFWVILTCQAAMGLGTLMGGWRIVKTMGQKITKLKPIGGFAAETGGALTLYIAYTFGIPVSTTHTITGAIIGVGAAQRLSAVRWGIAGNIVAAWILTIPATGLIAAGACWLGGRWF